MNTKIIITLFISSVITILILSQYPVYESLATAFNGDKIYTNKVENIIKKIIFGLAILLSLFLLKK